MYIYLWLFESDIYVCYIYICECLNQIYICECLNQFVRTSTNIIELIRYNQCYRTNSSSPTTLFNNSSNSDNIIKKFVQPYNIVQQLVQFNQYHITTRPILQHFPTIGGWDPNSKEYLSIPHLACSYLKLKQKARSRPRHSKGMINETKLEVLYKNQAWKTLSASLAMASIQNIEENITMLINNIEMIHINITKSMGLTQV